MWLLIFLFKKIYWIIKITKGRPNETLKNKKFLEVIDEENSEKIIIDKPKKKTKILEDL